jgi:hypothetical protein
MMCVQVRRPVGRGVLVAVAGTAVGLLAGAAAAQNAVLDAGGSWAAVNFGAPSPLVFGAVTGPSDASGAAQYLATLSPMPVSTPTNGTPFNEFLLKPTASSTVSNLNIDIGSPALSEPYGTLRFTAGPLATSYSLEALMGYSLVFSSNGGHVSLFLRLTDLTAGTGLVNQFLASPAASSASGTLVSAVGAGALTGPVVPGHAYELMWDVSAVAGSYQLGGFTVTGTSAVTPVGGVDPYLRLSVIPAPAGGVVLLAGGLAAGRRRRV